MRAESEKMDLERKKADIAERQYLLEEALNPVKIRQAEAEAARNAAQTGVYNIERDRGALELDALRRFGNGSASRQDFTQELPGQSNGGIPPISMDELDAPVPRVDIQKPGTPDDFAAMLSGGGPSVSPERSFSDVLSDAMSTTQGIPEQQPSSPRKDYFGEARLLVQSGRLAPDKMGSYILSREAMDQAGGSASPQDRLRLLSTGAGNPFSQDETLAQALGGQRSQEQLATMAEDRGLTSDIQNFRYAQVNPDFATMLASKNDGPSFSVTNPDGTTVTYGKNNGGKLTELQSKNALFATRAAQANKVLEDIKGTDYGRSLNNLDLRNATDYVAGMSRPKSASGALLYNTLSSPEGKRMYQAANSFLAAVVRPDSGAALTESEWSTYAKVFIDMPGDDPGTLAQKSADRRTAITALAALSNGGADTIASILSRSGAPIPPEIEAYIGAETNQPSPGVSSVKNAEPTISSDEEFDALPSGTFFYGPDGQRRRKP